MLCTCLKSGKGELPTELQDWSNNHGGVNAESLPKVKKILDKYLAFDFEWDINTHVLELEWYFLSHILPHLGHQKI